MKFMKIANQGECQEWINIDHISSFSFEQSEYNFSEQHSYGIQFNMSGYEDTAAWFKTKEERQKFLDKLKHHLGGWL